MLSAESGVLSAECGLEKFYSRSLEFQSLEWGVQSSGVLLPECGASESGVLSSEVLDQNVVNICDQGGYGG